VTELPVPAPGRTALVEAPAPPAAWTTWSGLLFGLMSLGSAAAAVVLPGVVEDLGVSTSDASWVVSGYVLMLAVFTAVFAGLGDAYGIRRPLALGVVVMSIGAVAAAVAPSFGLVVAGRILQGIGAAAVPPLVLALAATLGRREAPGRAVGRVTALATGIACLGPVIGGQVEALGGWRWVVVAPALACLLLVPLWRVMPARGTGARIDVVGAALVVVVAGAVVLMAQSPSSSLPLERAGLPMLVLGIPALAFRVRRRPGGFLPAEVVGDRPIVAAAVSASSITAIWFALLVAVPLELAARGWELWQVGVVLLPAAVGGFLGARASAPLVHRLGSRGALACSCAGSVVAAAVGAVGAFATGSWGPVLLVAASTVMASTAGIGQAALVVVVGERVRAEVRGIGIGVAQLVFLLGGAVGSAVAGSLFDVVGPAWTLAVLTALPAAGLLGSLAGIPQVHPQPQEEP
jgi:MFS family permease